MCQKNCHLRVPCKERFRQCQRRRCGGGRRAHAGVDVREKRVVCSPFEKVRHPNCVCISRYANHCCCLALLASAASAYRPLPSPLPDPRRVGCMQGWPLRRSLSRSLLSFESSFLCLKALTCPKKKLQEPWEHQSGRFSGM